MGFADLSPALHVFEQRRRAAPVERTSAYYKADNNNKKKTRNGINADWWGRSPDNSNSEKFCLAGLNGIADADYASEELSVSFGFCF